MAKLLFCFPRFHTNAIPWVRILQQEGHEVSMFVVIQAKTESYKVIKPVLVKKSWISEWIVSRFPGRGANCPRAFPGFREHWNAINRVDPDVVIVRDFSRLFSIVTAIICWLQRRPLVAYDQEAACPKPFSRAWGKRQVVRWVARAQFTSRRRLGEEIGCRGGALFIPFGLDRRYGNYRLVSRPAGHIPRILMVAKYRQRKGHQKLIDALAILAKETAFSMTFCGEEASEEDISFRRNLEVRAGSKGIFDRIKFLSNVDHVEMPKLYEDHDVFVLPSKNEPAAVSPIEAASFGCAVVISADSGTRGYFPAEERFSVDPDDPIEIAQKLYDLIVSPDRLESGRRECFYQIHQICSDERILRTFESFL